MNMKIVQKKKAADKRLKAVNYTSQRDSHTLNTKDRTYAEELQLIAQQSDNQMRVAMLYAPKLEWTYLYEQLYTVDSE